MEILSGAGTRVVENVAQMDSKFNTRVKIPANLVEDANRSAPETVAIYNRQGEIALELEERNYYFGRHRDNPGLIDPCTHKRIKMGYAEIEMSTTLIDYFRELTGSSKAPIAMAVV